MLVIWPRKAALGWFVAWAKVRVRFGENSALALDHNVANIRRGSANQRDAPIARFNLLGYPLAARSALAESAACEK